MKTAPPKPARPQGRYVYEGIFLHYGIIGDPFWKKLQRRDRKRKIRKLKMIRFFKRLINKK